MNFRNVLVFMSMTSTAALFRSVKYIRPLALSTPLMSKEKLLVDVMFGTAMRATTLTPLLLFELELLQLLPSVIAAIRITPRMRNVVMFFSSRFAVVPLHWTCSLRTEQVHRMYSTEMTQAIGNYYNGGEVSPHARVSQASRKPTAR